MELYILRHAIAVERGTPGFEEDSTRPLTPAGEGKMRQIAKGMRALSVDPDLILSSPYVRARQTAEIVAQTFKIPDRLVLTPHLEPGGDPHALLSEIVSHYGDRRRIVLVGHEPFLSELASMLTAGNTDLPIVLKKGGLCKLMVSDLRYGACATLEWLLTPRHLVLMAG
jgi:phosphohistidine phosphatase